MRQNFISFKVIYMFLCKFSIHISNPSLLCYGASQMVHWAGNDGSVSESRRGPGDGNVGCSNIPAWESPGQRNLVGCTPRGA